MAISQDEQKPAVETPSATPARAGKKDVVKTTALWGQDEDSDPQEFTKLLDLYDNSFRNIAEGEVVKGTVLKVTASEVIVDVGYKSEGIIAVDEFVDENGQVTVEPGDRKSTRLNSSHIPLSRMPSSA